MQVKAVLLMLRLRKRSNPTVLNRKQKKKLLKAAALNTEGKITESGNQERDQTS